MSNAKNKVGLITTSSLVIAAMIGTGVFTSLGFQVIDIKSGFSILLLWVIGGIVAFCGATSYAELGSVFPRSGGEYSLLSRLIHPSLGFVAGWVSATVGFAAPASIAAMALASYLKAFIPNIYENHVAAGFIVLLTALHATSLKIGAKFQNISTLLKVALIIAFVLSGFFVVNPTDIELLSRRSIPGMRL